MTDEKEVTKVEDLEVAPEPVKKETKKPVAAKPAAKKVSFVPKAKRYSFEQWAARNGVPSHHRGGRRAYVNNVSKHRTLEEWDECFKGY